jgi:hypothetical protein
MLLIYLMSFILFIIIVWYFALKGFFLFVFSIVILGLLHSTIKNLLVRRKASQAEAIIVDSQISKEFKEMSYPIFEYSISKYRKIRTVSTQCYSNIKIGEKVVVYYHPENPDKVISSSLEASSIRYFLVLCFIVVCVIFVFFY